MALTDPLRRTLGAVRRTVGPRALADVRRALGATRTAGHDSPRWRGGAFGNTEPMRVVESGTRAGMARELASKGRVGKPPGPVPLVRTQWPEQAADLAATWLGHATVLLEVGGRRVLTDPVWSERCSPSQQVGPRRNHPVPVPLEDLPPLDAVLVSHDHYDHLDVGTVDRLARLQPHAVWVVPLGIGAHLRGWGVPAGRVVELDWGGAHEPAGAGGLRLTCTPARHFSGRTPTGGNRTLWSSWLVTAGGRSMLFGGDTGWTPALADLGEEHGPVDLAVLPVGAYDRRWPDVHMDPAEAVRAHLALRGEVMLPIHWATFDLAFHPWAEPADRVREEAAQHGVRLAQPRPGERWAEGDPLPTATWWRGL